MSDIVSIDELFHSIQSRLHTESDYEQFQQHLQQFHELQKSETTKQSIISHIVADFLSDNMIYYNKQGVFSTAKSIQVDNESGKIIANQPGLHEVVAVCITEGGKRFSRTFVVDVQFPAVKEIKISLNSDKVYEGTYVPISY